MHRARTITALLGVIASLIVAGCGGSGSGRTDTPLARSATTGQKASTGSGTTASVPGDGSQVGSLAGDRGVTRLLGNASGSGFSIADTADDGSTIAIKGASGTRMSALSRSQLRGMCGAADVSVPALGRIVLTEQNTGAVVRLNAWTPATGRRIWTAVLIAVDRAPEVCDRGTGAPKTTASGTLEDVAMTADRRWGLAEQDSRTPVVIDLETGAIRRDPHAVATLGSFIIDEPTANGPFQLTDPGTGHRLSTLPATAYGTLDLPAGGWLPPEQGLDINPGAMALGTLALSRAGTILYVQANGEAGVSPDELAAYSLPSYDQRWTDQQVHQIIASAGDLLILLTGSDVDELSAVDQGTGKVAWTTADGQVCGVTAHQMLVLRGGSLHTIDLADGKQVGSPSKASGCPALYENGVGVRAAGSAVYQYLQP